MLELRLLLLWNVIICSQLLIISQFILKKCKDQLPLRITEARSIPTVSTLSIASAGVFLEMETRKMERMKNEKKTVRSDTMNSSFPSSSWFKDSFLILKSAFLRN